MANREITGWTPVRLPSGARLRNFAAVSAPNLAWSIASRVLFATLAGGIFGLLSWGLYRTLGPQRRDPHNPPIHRFAGLEGPREETRVPDAVPADWRAYGSGETSRLAILLTDENSDWLGLAHGLKSAGLPFRITCDAAEATRHRVVIVYPAINGRVLAPEDLRRLARHPERGGTVVGFGIEGGGLQEVFGFSAAEPSREHRVLRLADEPVLAEFTDPAEREIPVNSAIADSTVALLGFTPTTARPLARYEDGTAGVLHRSVGSGHAYAFGFDLGHLALKGFNDRQEGLARAYANQYEPVLDVWFGLLARIYRAGESGAVTLHPVPEGRPLAVVLSHDVDYTRSLQNALEYAALEAAQGVAATYFVQAKYVQDWNDDIFLNHTAPAVLRELLARGAEIASHSVAHFRAFERFPLGTGRERYPDYRPFVVTRVTAVNGSILGEVRVSRFLLEHLAPGASVVSFRPGHLRNPFALPQALEGAGYRFSSAATANSALTHRPFRLTHSRGKTAASGIYEFPVTIEDELPPALPTRLAEALGLAERIAKHGGLYMVLIHTDKTGEKLEFQRQLTEELQRRGAWFGRLDHFGPWWVARDAVEVDAESAPGRLTVRLRAAAPVTGLALLLPGRGWGLARGSGTMSDDGSRIVVDLRAGKTVLELHR